MTLTAHFNWRGIPVRATLDPDACPDYGLARLHIAAPCPLPIASTGTLSVLTPHEGIIVSKGPEAFVRAWLDQVCAPQLLLFA